MLDTVILTIPEKEYTITDPGRFQPNADYIRKCYLVKGVNNPTLQEKSDGIYRPRLTIMRRPASLHYGQDIPLRIEFSAPKLLFGNNIDELEEKDFDSIVATLRYRMKKMGVETTADAIQKAKVSAMHVSKNIRLKEYTSRHVIGEIGKVNVNRKIDIGMTRFKNSGKALYFHTNTSQFVLYDKIADMDRQKGRAADKDQTQKQFEIFDQLQTSKNDIEILRLEVRLSNPQKLNSILKQLGYKQPPTFEYIFNKELCQKIMRLYWSGIVSKQNYFLFDTDNSPQKLLRKIIAGYDTGPKQYIYLVGLKTLCKDADGIRGLRLCLEKNCSPKTWSRIAKDFDILNSLNSGRDYQGWLKQINYDIDEFKTLKLADCAVKNCKVLLQ